MKTFFEIGVATNGRGATMMALKDGERREFFAYPMNVNMMSMSSRIQDNDEDLLTHCNEANEEKTNSPTYHAAISHGSLIPTRTHRYEVV